MNFKEALIGGGGSSGGSTSNYRSTPDDLRSTDTFEGLVGIATGRIQGLSPGGLKKLYINNVPIEDGQGNATFKDFVATLFDGDPTYLNPIKLQLGGSAGATIINLPLANTYSAGTPGDWVFGQVTVPNCDFIDIRFMVQQLFRQDANGIYDETANIEVQLQPSGSTSWINPLINTAAPPYSSSGQDVGSGTRVLVPQQAYATGSTTTWSDPTPGYVTVTGKTTSGYIKELRVAVPNAGAWANRTWTVRARLKEQASTDDGAGNTTERTISWESIAGVSSAPIGGTEPWRALSYLHILGKASDQISGRPQIDGVYDLKMVRVPPSTVWNPATRAYAGPAWDGVTTQLAWTQCPAFLIKDIIEDSISGVSALVPGSSLNKWDALEASKWFSQLVPDGKGGMHPRYSLNYYIDQPMQVSELVNYMAGAVGGFAWDEGNGKWRLKVEKQSTSSMLFTKENIVGEFTYSHTDVDTRYNDITGVFRDEDSDYSESRIRVFKQSDIDAYGRKPTTIALVGCSNQQEAIRRLWLRLLTSINETRIVNFTTNRQGLLLQPLDTISVCDGDLGDSAKRTTGRIIGIDATRKIITMRDTVRLEPGVAYNITFTTPNAGYNPDTVGQPADPTWAHPTITVSGTVATASPRGDVTTITLNAALPSNLPDNANFALDAPGLPALPKQFRVLTVTPQDSDNAEFVQITAIEIYTSKWAESDNITLAAINAQRPSLTVPPPTIPSDGMFHLDSFVSPLGATQQMLTVRWDRPGSLWVDGFRVSYRWNAGPWNDWVKLTSDTQIELPNPIYGNYEFRIYTVDKRGAESIPLTGSVTIDETMKIPPSGYLTQPVITIATAADGTGGNFTGAQGNFVVMAGSGQIPANQIHYEVLDPTNHTWVTINSAGLYTCTDSHQTQVQATLRATYNSIPIDCILQVVKAKAGMDGGGDGIAPDTPTGLALVSNIALDDYGQQWIKLTASWQPAHASDLAGYVIAIKEGTNEYIEFSVGPLISSFFIQALPNTVYTAKICSYDTYGLRSPFSAEVSCQTAVDVLPPDPPYDLSTTAAFQTIFIEWISPPQPDTAWVEIYESTTNNVASAYLLNKVASGPNAQGSFGRTGLTPNTTMYYWLRAVDTSGNRSAYSVGVSATTAYIQPVDISGQLSDAQVASLAASKITGQLTDSQIASIDAAKLAGQITAAQIANGAIGGTAFASGFEPIQVVNALPAVGGAVEGQVVLLTTDGKLYRFHSGAWTAAVASGDLVGQIPGTQITPNSITSSQIAANTITANNIAAGTITAAELAVDSVNAGHIQAGAITASELAVDSVTAGKLAANSITSREIVAGTIVASDIAANTITAAQIAANTITATNIAAGTITAANIAAGTILASNIAAATITGDRIAANTIATNNLAALSVTAAKIAAGTITADKMNVATLSAITAQIGLLRTAASGARTEMQDNQIRVYDANGIMRVRMGVW